MGIYTNPLQHQTVVTIPLKTDKTNWPIDLSIKNVADVSSAQKIEAIPEAFVNETKAVKKSDELKQAVGQLNDYVQNMLRDLKFSLDKESGITVVKVIDTKSEKVIRQIPSEEAIKLARSLTEQKNSMPLSIFSSKA